MIWDPSLLQKASIRLAYHASTFLLLNIWLLLPVCTDLDKLSNKYYIYFGVRGETIS